MVSESVDMTVETGTFSANNGFTSAVQDAACTGMVGTCSVSLVDRRRLHTSPDATQPLVGQGSSGPEHPGSPHLSARRRLGATLTVTREYDYGASASSSSPVSELVEGGLADMGVTVTSSTTTSLSAESTVTAVDDEGSNSNAVAGALDTSTMAGALANYLPSVTLDISEPLVITPPVAPPPSPSLPPAAPPVPNPSPPMAPKQKVSLLALSISVSVLVGIPMAVAIASMLMLHWRRKRAKVLPCVPAADPTLAPSRQAGDFAQATDAQNGGSDARNADAQDGRTDAHNGGADVRGGGAVDHGPKPVASDLVSPVASDLVSRTEQLASRVYQAREEVGSPQSSPHNAAAQRLQKALSRRSNISPRATFVAGPLSPFSTSAAKYSVQNVGDSSGHRGGEQLQATRALASLDKQSSARDVEPVSEPMAGSGPGARRSRVGGSNFDKLESVIID